MLYPFDRYSDLIDGVWIAQQADTTLDPELGRSQTSPDRDVTDELALAHNHAGGLVLDEVDVEWAIEVLINLVAQPWAQIGLR